MEEEQPKVESSGLIEDEPKQPEPQKAQNQDDDLLEEEEVKQPEKVEEVPVVEKKVVDPKLLEKKQKYLAILDGLKFKELKNVDILLINSHY